MNLRSSSHQNFPNLGLREERHEGRERQHRYQNRGRDPCTRKWNPQKDEDGNYQNANCDGNTEELRDCGDACEGVVVYDRILGVSADTRRTSEYSLCIMSRAVREE